MSELSRKSMIIGIAVLAVLGTVMLSLERATYVLPVITFVSAVFSVYFTDLRGKFFLNKNVASGLALLGAAISLREFLQFDRSLQLLAIADLLIYLQLVLLFQRKTIRIYWQLITVSQLQVVVAAALSITPLFGLLLGIYSAVAIVTLLLFFVYRETHRVRPDEETVSTHQESPASDQRWSLQPQSMAWTPLTTLSASTKRPPSGRLSLARRLVRSDTWGAWRVGPSLALTTLLVTLLTFLAVPRHGKRPWQTPTISPQRTVGFSPRVKLGQLGSVAENPSTVMRIQFLDSKTRKPIKLVEPPLLRGAVMTRYIHSQSRSATSQWSNPRSPRNSYSSASSLEELERPQQGDSYTIQRITLEALDEPVVFSIFPALALRDDVIKFNENNMQLVRGNETLRSKQIVFELGTTGITGRRQDMLVPEPKHRGQGWLLGLPRGDSEVPPLAGLSEIAERVVNEAGISPENHYDVAKKLERFLQTEGGFQYSLQPVHRDPGIDPVEDFVVTHRQGHCEYFASALALMLRSQGIPARVIIGFRGGEWNEVGKYYQVRQLHAHTWVEAYLSKAQLAQSNRGQSKKFKKGGWLILDGTAEASLPSDPVGTLASLSDYIDYSKLLWTNYIVGMSRYKQDESIYGPIASVYQAARQAAVDAFSSGRPLMFLETISSGVLTWLRGNWFSWRGGLAAILLCLFLYVTSVIGRWIFRIGNRWLKHSQAVRYQRRGRVRFYDQLERLLRKHGIRRSEGQTPRELAGAAAGHLAESPTTSSVSALPGQLVDAYYRIRFGNRPLDNQELESVELSLAQLELALKGRR